MAEVVGLAASVLQIGGAGAKLSIELYNFISTASRADTDITHIAIDVETTSKVLGSVGRVLDSDNAKKLVNQDAIQHAKDLIKQCEEVFNELSDVVSRARRPAGQGKSRIGFRVKMAWPMKEQRVELLRRRLETLKSSLQVLFHVLQLAHDKARGDVELAYLEEQKQTIRSLHQQQQSSLAILQALEKKLCADATAPVQVSATPVPAPAPQPVLSVLTTRVPPISTPNAQDQIQRNDAAMTLFKDVGPDTSATDTDTEMTSDEGEHLTVDELAQCAKQVQKLLRRIMALQESLKTGPAEKHHRKRRMHKVYQRFCRGFESVVGEVGEVRDEGLAKPVSVETLVEASGTVKAVSQVGAGRILVPASQQISNPLEVSDNVAARDGGRRRRYLGLSPLPDALTTSSKPRKLVVKAAKSRRPPATRSPDTHSRHYSDLYTTQPSRPQARQHRRTRYFDSPDENADRRLEYRRDAYEPRRTVRRQHHPVQIYGNSDGNIFNAREHRPFESYTDSESSNQPERSDNPDDRTRSSRRAGFLYTSSRSSPPPRRHSGPRPTITERSDRASTPAPYGFVRPRRRRLSFDSADDVPPPPARQKNTRWELARGRDNDLINNSSRQSQSQSRQGSPMRIGKSAMQVDDPPRVIEDKALVPSKRAKKQAYYSTVSDEEPPPRTPTIIPQPLLPIEKIGNHRLRSPSSSLPRERSTNGDRAFDRRERSATGYSSSISDAGVRDPGRKDRERSATAPRQQRDEGSEQGAENRRKVLKGSAQRPSAATVPLENLVLEKSAVRETGPPEKHKKNNEQGDTIEEGPVTTASKSPVGSAQPRYKSEESLPTTTQAKENAAPSALTQYFDNSRVDNKATTNLLPSIEGFVDSYGFDVDTDPDWKMNMVIGSAGVKSTADDSSTHDRSATRLGDVSNAGPDAGLAIDMGGADDGRGLNSDDMGTQVDDPALTEVGATTSWSHQNDLASRKKSTVAPVHSPPGNPKSSGSASDEDLRRFRAEEKEHDQLQLEHEEAQPALSKKSKKRKKGPPVVKDVSEQPPRNQPMEKLTMQDIYLNYKQRAGMGRRAAAPEENRLRQDANDTEYAVSVMREENVKQIRFETNQSEYKDEGGVQGSCSPRAQRRIEDGEHLRPQQVAPEARMANEATGKRGKTSSSYNPSRRASVQKTAVEAAEQQRLVLAEAYQMDQERLEAEALESKEQQKQQSARYRHPSTPQERQSDSGYYDPRGIRTTQPNIPPSSHRASLSGQPRPNLSRRNSTHISVTAPSQIRQDDYQRPRVGYFHTNPSQSRSTETRNTSTYRGGLTEEGSDDDRYWQLSQIGTGSEVAAELTHELHRGSDRLGSDAANASDEARLDVEEATHHSPSSKVIVQQPIVKNRDPAEAVKGVVRAESRDDAAASIIRRRSREDDGRQRNDHEARSSSPIDDNRKSEKWEQAAKAAIVAGAVEAFRNRNITEAWTGSKGQRITTAALGAAGIDGLIGRDGVRSVDCKITDSALGGLAANRHVEIGSKKGKGKSYTPTVSITTGKSKRASMGSTSGSKLSHTVRTGSPDISPPLQSPQICPQLGHQRLPSSVESFSGSGRVTSLYRTSDDSDDSPSLATGTTGASSGIRPVIHNGPRHVPSPVNTTRAHSGSPASPYRTTEVKPSSTYDKRPKQTERVNPHDSSYASEIIRRDEDRKRRYGPLGFVGPFGRSEKAKQIVVDAPQGPVFEVERGGYAGDLQNQDEQEVGEPMDIVDVLLERWTKPVGGEGGAV